VVVYHLVLEDNRTRLHYAAILGHAVAVIVDPEISLL